MVTTDDGSDYVPSGAPSSDSMSVVAPSSPEETSKPPTSYNEGTHSRVWSRSDLDLIQSLYAPHQKKDGKVLRKHTRLCRVLSKRLIKVYPDSSEADCVRKLTYTARAQFMLKK